MLTKVNQVVSTAQAARWRSRADIVGLCIGRGPRQGPWIPVETAAEVRRELGDVRVAVTLRPKDGFTAAETERLLRELHADLHEFTPVDPRKADAFDAELRRLEDIGIPKVANGFFLLPDDLGFLDEEAAFARLAAAGVELLQFELETGAGSSARVPAPALARFADLAAHFPILVSDGAATTDGYPVPTIAGFFFDIAAGDEPNYDSTERRRPESEIARIARRAS